MYYGCSRSITKRFPDKCHEPYVQEREAFELFKPAMKELHLTRR